MAKKKKISFQPYLRKSERGYKDGFFKVYLRVNFNAESNMFSDALFDGRSLYWTEEDLEKWNQGDYTGSYKGEAIELQQSLTFYEGVIRYEYEKNPDLFRLKGLGKTVSIYRRNVLLAAQSRIRYYFAVLGENFDSTSSLSELAAGRKFIEFLSTNKAKFSSVDSDLLSLYTLLYLYSDAYFNHNYDFHLGFTLYEFIVREGITNFNRFVDNYLTRNEEALDFLRLDDEMNSNPFFQQECLPIMNLFPPQKERGDRYKYLFKEYVRLVEAEA